MSGCHTDKSNGVTAPAKDADLQVCATGVRGEGAGLIHGIGIEIVDLERFRVIIERRGQGFLTRLFTPDEIAYCALQRRSHEHFAGRFAVKMSVIKAAGRELRLKFRDIEVVRGKNGKPEICAAKLGPEFKVAVSISHDGGLGVGQAIIERRG